MTTPTILVAEDDPDDRLLTKDAFDASGLQCDLRYVEDGEQLLDYLYHRGIYSDPLNSPRPALILLDLNMPRKDGWEAYREIRTEPSLSDVHVMVLTTSEHDPDRLIEAGLSPESYIIKPGTFGGLLAVVRKIGLVLAAKTGEVGP